MKAKRAPARISNRSVFLSFIRRRLELNAWELSPALQPVEQAEQSDKARHPGHDCERQVAQLRLVQTKRDTLLLLGRDAHQFLAIQQPVERIHREIHVDSLGE